MKKIALLGGALLGCAAAQAATISFDFDAPLQKTEINQTGSLGLFDSALGTLTGISLRVFGGNETTITLTNRGTNSEAATTSSVTNLYFSSGLAGLDALFAATDGRQLLSLTNDTGLQFLASGATAGFGPKTDSDERALAIATGSAAWNSLQAAGGGAFNVNCLSLSGLTVLGGGGNIEATQQSMAQCGAEIVYTYDAVTQPPNAVPEPASFALAGAALLGAFTARRRRGADTGR